MCLWRKSRKSHPEYGWNRSVGWEPRWTPRRTRSWDASSLLPACLKNVLWYVVLLSWCYTQPQTSETLNQNAYFVLSYCHSGEELTNTVPTSTWINRISHVISAPIFNIPQPKDWTPLLMMELVFPHWSRAHEYVLFPTVVEALGSHSVFPGSFSPTAAEGPTAKLTWVMSALKDLDLTLCEVPCLPR